MREGGRRVRSRELRLQERLDDRPLLPRRMGRLYKTRIASGFPKQEKQEVGFSPAPAESTAALPTPGSQPPEMLPDSGLRTVMCRLVSF